MAKLQTGKSLGVLRENEGGTSPLSSCLTEPNHKYHKFAFYLFHSYTLLPSHIIIFSLFFEISLYCKHGGID